MGDKKHGQYNNKRKKCKHIAMLLHKKPQNKVTSITLRSGRGYIAHGELNWSEREKSLQDVSKYHS